jgi:hypothetical protein
MEGPLVSRLIAQEQGEPFLVYAFRRETLVLKADGALREPIGLSDFLDQNLFGSSSWPVLVHESGYQGSESRRIFAGDDELSGSEPMLQGITRRSHFAFRGARAGRVLRVGAIDFGTAIGRRFWGGGCFQVLARFAKRTQCGRGAVRQVRAPRHARDAK